MKPSFRNLLDYLLLIANEFNKNNVKYVLFGGLAVILYGMPRFTEDIDFMIAVDKENIEKIKTIFKKIFNDNYVEDITFEDFKKYSVIRYGTPKDFYIDLVYRIGEVATFDEIYKNRDVLTIEGVDISIINKEDLFLLKKGTVREVDKIDARFLKHLIEKTNTNTK